MMAVRRRRAPVYRDALLDGRGRRRVAEIVACVTIRPVEVQQVERHVTAATL